MESITAHSSPTVRPWAHLSPDLLLDVSNRLDDAADFARFHAVCTPWRNAAPSLHSPAATRPAFSPWLLALCGTQVIHSTIGLLGCASSLEEASDGGEGVLVEPPGATTSSTGGGGRTRNWVASADGTAAWLFVASPTPRLVHLLTGAVTVLPRFPDRDEITVPMENARGIVYGDGTVFLYNFLYKNRLSTFTAAIRRPGGTGTAWRVLRRSWDVPTTLSSATYHDGKILLSFSEYFWTVLIGGGGAGDLQSRWNGEEERNYSRESNHLLESRGELLWASVLVKRGWIHGHARADRTSSALSVTVHALEKGAGGVMRWAPVDGWRLADRVLFLGSPASFAVDADRLGVGGGCAAYFVFRHCVFRYGFLDGEAELVRRLPRRWGGDAAGVWLWPEPAIAPIQEIRRRLMKKKMPWDVLGLYS